MASYLRGIAIGRSGRYIRLSRVHNAGPVQVECGWLSLPKRFTSRATYRHQACEVVKYLVTQEGWSDLLQHVESEYQVECGARLKTRSDNQRDASDNVRSMEGKTGGNSKSYTLQRLARDAETNPEVADVYEKVKQGAISANKAAIQLGWRVPTITVRKEAERANR